MDVSEGESFRRLSDGEPISSPAAGRSTGWRASLRDRPANQQERRINGAASIAIPTRTWTSFGASWSSGRTRRLPLSTRWLAGGPQPPAAGSDRSQRHSAVYRFPSERSAGFYHSAVSPADGLSRIVGYRKIDRWPLVATARVIEAAERWSYSVELRAGLSIGVPLSGRSRARHPVDRPPFAGGC